MPPPRRSDVRRAEILKQASRLFREQGYHATTMDDVADAVKLNKGTLYYYYESKANLLFEILLNTNERRLAAMRSQATGVQPELLVKAYVEDTIDYLAEHPVEASVSFQEAPFLHLWLSRDQVNVLRARQAEFEKFALDAVRAGQEAGIFAEDLDARVVAHALTAIVSWFVRWYRPNGRLSAHAVAAQSSLLVLRGLLSPGHLHRAESLVAEVTSGGRGPAKGKATRPVAKKAASRRS
jgi:AcrR family transcriptional regulator